MILFFDTETTGLPKNWKAPVTDLDNWPRLVQLAFLVYDFDGNLIHSCNEIIKPNGFTIPIDASKVHGITTDIANQRGSQIEDVFELFSIHLKRAKVIVAHNMAYDEKIIGSELIRIGLVNTLDSKEKICTMESTVDLCKIDGPYGYKWPKLEELHRFLFNHDFEGAHDALADIQATAKCFWELVNRKLIPEYKSVIREENRLFELKNEEIKDYYLFFRSNINLAKLIISIYYPFNRFELEKFWNVIIKGEAFYTCLINDIDTVYQPKLGLCFNENLLWDNALKKHWEIGVADLFNGTIEGTGLDEIISFEDYNKLFDIIPLNLKRELEYKNSHIINFWINNFFNPEDEEPEPPETINEEIMNVEFPTLTFSEFKAITDKYKGITIFNKSIWKNTLSKIFLSHKIYYFLNNDKILKINEAIKNEYKLRIIYQNAENEISIRILINVNYSNKVLSAQKIQEYSIDDNFITGFCCKRNEIRTFKIDRIIELSILKKAKNINVSEFENDYIVPIKIGSLFNFCCWEIKTNNSSYKFFDYYNLMQFSYQNGISKTEKFCARELKNGLEYWNSWKINFDLNDLGYGISNYSIEFNDELKLNFSNYNYEFQENYSRLFPYSKINMFCGIQIFPINELFGVIGIGHTSPPDGDDFGITFYEPIVFIDAYGKLYINNNKCNEHHFFDTFPTNQNITDPDEDDLMPF